MNARKRALGFGLGAAALAVAAGMAQQQAQRPSASVDTIRVARTIVTECAGINRDDLVWITGGVRDQQLLEDIAVEVRKLGAFPLITIESDRLTQRMISDVPEKFDTQDPAFRLKLAEMIDAVISVDYQERPDLLAGVSPQRITKLHAAEQAVYEKLRERNVVSIHLGNDLYPTEARAKQFGIPQADLHRIFWNGVNTDYARLQSLGERVMNLLASGTEVKITAPNGTNLTMQIANREVFVSDGVVSQTDRSPGGPAAQVWLPAGEVYLAPVPGTANGTFIADTFFHEGKLIEALKLEFKAGKLTNMTAKSDISALRKLYDAAPAPARDVFAAVDIGINAGIEVPKNSRMITWMAAGTISVGIGDNRWAGGENSVPYGLFAQLIDGTLAVDGRNLIDRGRLLEK